jgi:hypothetical protein
VLLSIRAVEKVGNSCIVKEAFKMSLSMEQYNTIIALAHMDLKLLEQYVFSLLSKKDQDVLLEEEEE